MVPVVSRMNKDMFFSGVDLGTDDEVRVTQPQNMAPWHIKYFKLTEFEKTTEAGRSL